MILNVYTYLRHFKGINFIVQCKVKGEERVIFLKADPQRSNFWSMISCIVCGEFIPTV